MIESNAGRRKEGYICITRGENRIKAEKTGKSSFTEIMIVPNFGTIHQI